MGMETDGYRNESLCAGCGGDCCRIYENGRLKKRLTIQAWSDMFHSFRVEYDVAPLFHADVVHIRENAHLVEILREKNIDPYACEYMASTGCTISWDKRPSQCVAFRCEAFRSTEIKGEANVQVL